MTGDESREPPRDWEQVVRAGLVSAEDEERVRYLAQAMARNNEVINASFQRLTDAAGAVNAAMRQVAGEHWREELEPEPEPVTGGDPAVEMFRRARAEAAARRARWTGTGVRPGEVIDGVTAGLPGLTAPGDGRRAPTHAPPSVSEHVSTRRAAPDDAVTRVTAWESVHTFTAYANPFAVCDTCLRPTPAWHNPERCDWCAGAGWAERAAGANWWNVPCGHVDGVQSWCGTWTPEDGCRCVETGWTYEPCQVPGDDDDPPRVRSHYRGEVAP